MNEEQGFGTEELGKPQNGQNYEHVQGEQSAQHGAGPQDRQGQAAQGYNFKTPVYSNFQPTGSRPDFGGGKKGFSAPHPSLGREIGLFAAKAAIGAVIGIAVLAVAGTIALNATDKAIYIVNPNEPVTIGDTGNDDFSDYFRNFGGGNPGAGEYGNGEQRQGGAGGSQEENDGPKLGVEVEAVSDQMVKQGYPAGVLIVEVADGSPAAKAGLKAGDIITSFNGAVVKTPDELAEAVRSIEEDDQVKIVYKRLENGGFKAYDADASFSDAASSSAESSPESGAESGKTNE